MAHVIIPFLLVGVVLLATTDATVYWDKCQVEADHPPMIDGNYFHLCIKDEQWDDRVHAWMFTKAYIGNTTFNNCQFVNQRRSPNNFTEAVWKDVLFDGCYFGSQDLEFGSFITFDFTLMTNVVFRNTIFDYTVTTLFDNFELNDVVFENCTFKGNTVFRSGTINTVHFRDSIFVHNPQTMQKSENESLYFRLCTINTMISSGNNFVNPIRFEGVDANDLSFNESKLNDMYCHGPDDKQGKVTLRSAFTSGSWDNCEFRGDVVCDETRWRGFYGTNLTFYENADFSKSKIDGIFWDGVVSVVNPGQEITTLNFSESVLTREALTNISVDGRADFERTQFTRVRIKNLEAKVLNFESAAFNEQEFIDGECCSVACGQLNCTCNVTMPSGTCPSADRPVNQSVPVLTCFPSDATVRTEKGNIVHMSDLMFGERVRVSHDLHSDVYFFGHRLESEVVQYTQLRYADDAKSLRISPQHYLYVNGGLQTASSVRLGDRLRAVDGTDSLIVSSIKSVFARGAYAPTTLHGDVIVDDVIVSSYTDALHPTIAHQLLAPIRFLYRFGFHRAVKQFTMFEQHSWASVPQSLGILRGPTSVSG